MKPNQAKSFMPVFELRNANDLNEFIDFWSQFYNYGMEQEYNDRINKIQYDIDDIQRFYIWKNGMTLSEGKQKSLEQNIKAKLSIINKLKSQPIVDFEDFNKAFGDLSAVWKIFLMHIIKPDQYPIYDQHIHRAFNFINGLEYNDISANSLSNKKKEEFYFKKYLPFIKNAEIVNLKKMDEAFFSFGQFVNSVNNPKNGQFQYRLAKASKFQTLKLENSIPTSELLGDLASPKECLKYIQENCEGDIDLEKKVRIRRYELLAEGYGYKSMIERELLIVLYAYEDALTKKNNRTTRAGRTWPMVKKEGILKAAEKAVNRKFDPVGYKTLLNMGLPELTFEAIIIKYPECFQKTTVEIAKTRLNEAREYEMNNKYTI